MMEYKIQVQQLLNNQTTEGIAYNTGLQNVMSKELVEMHRTL